MRVTKFAGAIEPNMHRGILVLLMLAMTGCIAADESDLDDIDVDESGVAAQVALPIEVLGKEGTEEVRELSIVAPTGMTDLILRCNGCGYHDNDRDKNETLVKATVSINGGTPIALKNYTEGENTYGNKSIEILGAAKNYGGIGGLFRTVEMRIPLKAGTIKAGKNTFKFKYNKAAPPSIGFRIIGMDIIRNGQRVLKPSHFNVDDPGTWTPPLNNNADIAAGKSLWADRDILNDPGIDAINGSDGPAIVASCADCHTSDGSDLKYFNFSNRSIIQRAIFHGLSDKQGKQIASYIRSLKQYAYVSAARPWNPPYQPGPGLDARPVYEWAAGAGVNAILDNDASMKQYLFPKGDSLAEVRKVVDRFGKLNLRELPVSLPMPEWNQWLPQVHPDDAFNTGAAAIKQDKDGNNVPGGKPYYKFLYENAKQNPTSDNIGNMTRSVKTWLAQDIDCYTNGGDGGSDTWRGLNGRVLSTITLPRKVYPKGGDCPSERPRKDEEAYEVAKHGLHAWLNVKQWEILHGKNLEDEGKKEHTAKVDYASGDRTLNSKNVCAGTCVDARERGWFVTGRNLFDRAAHFVGHNSRNLYGQSEMVGVGETNAWYHLNMILNPGYRIMMPNHFAYVCSHIEFLQDRSKGNQGFRFWASMIKQRQLQTNGLYGVETGLDLRTAQPYVYYRANRNGNSNTQKSVGQPLVGRLVTAMLEDFVEDAKRATDSEWNAAKGNSDVQDLNAPASQFGDGTFIDTGDWQGRNTRRVMKKLRDDAKADSAAVTNLNNWAKDMWPNGPWGSLL